MSVALTSGRGVNTKKDASGKVVAQAVKKGAKPDDGGALITVGLGAILIGVVVACLLYMLKMNSRVMDDLVVNMIDVGEETGELDTMLYKIADNYDEEVSVMTEGLTKLIEPMLIVFLGVAVGFIVISLFMPLISLITSLSG